MSQKRRAVFENKKWLGQLLERRDERDPLRADNIWWWFNAKSPVAPGIIEAVIAELSVKNQLFAAIGRIQADQLHSVESA